MRKKIKNTILKTIAGIVGILWVLSAACMDSPSWIPAIVYIASLAYLGLFAYANREYFEKVDENV